LSSVGTVAPNLSIGYSSAHPQIETARCDVSAGAVAIPDEDLPFSEDSKPSRIDLVLPKGGCERVVDDYSGNAKINATIAIFAVPQ
jgi:hypothetical protein